MEDIISDRLDAENLIIYNKAGSGGKKTKMKDSGVESTRLSFFYQKHAVTFLSENSHPLADSIGYTVNRFKQV